MANLTPADIRNIAFNKPPLGRRGYDEEEVDSFLDEVERTLTALYGEIEHLRSQVTAPVPATPPADPSDSTLHAEVDLIKQRLARVEQTLGIAGRL